MSTWILMILLIQIIILFIIIYKSKTGNNISNKLKEYQGELFDIYFTNYNNDKTIWDYIVPPSFVYAYLVLFIGTLSLIIFTILLSTPRIGAFLVGITIVLAVISASRAANAKNVKNVTND